VELDGEVWTAVCKDESEIESGADVYIIARDGLTLEVSLNEASVPRGIPF
jgi:membrane protein implicated in regulation of membrane protease activity